MRTLFLIVAMLVAGIASSQNIPQITVSSEKVKVNGEVMYVHKVKSKETLFSIAKAYNVTVDDIVRKNEQLKGGLKEGSTIYIPSNKTAAEAGNASPAVAGEHNTVAASITPAAKKEEKLSGSQIKKYSKKKHTVKWYETLEDIAAKYSVSVDDIMEFNRLKSTVVEKKQVLYIPNDLYLAMVAREKEQEKIAQQEQVKDAEQPQQLSPEEVIAQYKEDPNFFEVDYPYNKELDILYILPLNLQDTIAPNSNFMDFYMGALLSQTTTGYAKKTRITLVDQQMYGSIDEIISTGVLENKDIIVGPVKPADVSKVLSAAERKSIVFSPIDQGGERLAEGNPLLVQVPPTAQEQQRSIVNLFADKCTPDKNAIIIYETGGVDTTHLRIAKEILLAKGVGYKLFSYGILEGRAILDKMNGYIKPDTENNVLVLSNSEAFVSDVVRNLNLIHTNPVEENRRKITLFGLPRWRNFETIEVDYFHRMNLHLSLPYFVDYNNRDVQDFIMKYRALFNSEPTPFAFQGYDIGVIANGILQSVARPITAFSTIPEYNIAFGLQVEHNYKRDGAGNGLLNTGTRNIVYNSDYTISVIE